MAIDLLIEGIDLSGKTTVAKHIFEKNMFYQLRANQLSSDSPFYSFAKNIFSLNEMEHKYSDEAISYLYLAALTNDIDMYKDDKITTIQVSTYATRSLAYHIANNTRFVKEFKDLLVKFPDPKNTFYLYANMTEMYRRLHERQKQSPADVSTSDLILQNDPVLFEKTEKILRNIVLERFNAKIIDTTNRTAQETCDIIMRLYHS